MPASSWTTITGGTNSPPVVGAFAVHEAPAPHQKFPPPFYADGSNQLSHPLTSASRLLSTEYIRKPAKGHDDIFPDEMSRGALDTWRKDPKQLERQLAGLRWLEHAVRFDPIDRHLPWSAAQASRLAGIVV